MPELPEVEITRRGLSEHLVGATVIDAVIRNARLRWPIPENLPHLLRNHSIISLERRAKYLLIILDNGTLILHLGMSGSLRILTADVPPQKHDHFDLLLSNGKVMRLRDPRRFGAVLWCEENPRAHPLLANLGVEPLEDEFTAAYLYQATRGKTAAIKLVIMDNHIVVGVGNIYANESLFRSVINPQLAAGKLSLARCKKLVAEIRLTLLAAIEQGGSSLRDFVHSDGSSGYFQQTYFVYGRGGEPCRKCASPIKQIKQGQRSSFFCGACQK